MNSPLPLPDPNLRTSNGGAPSLGDTTLFSEEMCAQFSRLINQDEDQYWGEKSLLRVLLNRYEASGAEAFLPENDDSSAYNDHEKRRALISTLLGLNPDHNSILSEGDEEMMEQQAH